MGLSLAVAWSVIARTEIEGPLAAARNAADHLAVVRSRFDIILADATGSVIYAPGDELPIVDPVSVRLFVPREDLPRIAAETGVRLTSIGDTFLAFRAVPPTDLLVPGQWVYHDVVLDGRGGAHALLEVSRPTSYGSIIVDPVIADRESGIWLVHVVAPPSSAAPVSPGTAMAAESLPPRSRLRAGVVFDPRGAAS